MMMQQSFSSIPGLLQGVEAFLALQSDLGLLLLRCKLLKKRHIISYMLHDLLLV